MSPLLGRWHGFVFGVGLLGALSWSWRVGLSALAKGVGGLQLILELAMLTRLIWRFGVSKRIAGDC